MNSVAFNPSNSVGAAGAFCHNEALAQPDNGAFNPKKALNGLQASDFEPSLELSEANCKNLALYKSHYVPSNHRVSNQHVLNVLTQFVIRLGSSNPEVEALLWNLTNKRGIDQGFVRAKKGFTPTEFSNAIQLLQGK